MFLVRPEEEASVAVASAVGGGGNPPRHLLPLPAFYGLPYDTAFDELRVFLSASVLSAPCMDRVPLRRWPYALPGAPADTDQVHAGLHEEEDNEARDTGEKSAIMEVSSEEPLDKPLKEEAGGLDLTGGGATLPEQEEEDLTGGPNPSPPAEEGGGPEGAEGEEDGEAVGEGDLC